MRLQERKAACLLRLRSARAFTLKLLRPFLSRSVSRPLKFRPSHARVGSPMRAATRAIDAVVTIASPPEVHSTTPACPRVRSRPSCQRAAEACGLRPQAKDSAVARGWHKPLNSLEREGQSQANADLAWL